MTFMRQLTLAAVLAAASVGTAFAQDSKPVRMLCAITNTATCDDTQCIRGSAEAVNLPVFLRFDTAAKTVEAARSGGERRTSAILSMSSVADTLVLLGGELGRGWTFALDMPSGTFTGSVSEKGTGYVIFGSCLGQ